MSYKNTFIVVSADSTVTSAIVPPNDKPTIASIEYELVSNNPYLYTQEEVQFKTYLLKNNIDSTNLDELHEQFFLKPKACFRASPLVKKYGWGIHYNAQGKIAIYDMNSDEYNQLLKMNNITLLKGMRTKRK